MYQLLQPLMLRRLKEDVNTGIPPKREIYVACPMVKLQKQWYLRILARDSESINKTKGSGDSSTLNNIVMHLRKAVNHPYCFPEADPMRGLETSERIINDCGKMIVLDKLLKRLYDDKAANNKVLVFSQFTMMLDIMEDYLCLREYNYCRIDGGTSSYDREYQMADFNNENSDKFVFMLSTRAGGLGVNLQGANNVIIFDSDWNPSMDLQAQDRAHRIGQKRQVTIFRFVTEGTIEQRIYERALAKLYLDAAVVQQGRLAARLADQDAITREELLSAVRFGADEMFRSLNSNDNITDGDIDRLLNTGEQKDREMRDKVKGEQQASLASFKLGAHQSSLYDFEGMDFSDQANEKSMQSKTLLVKLSDPTPQSEIEEEFAAFGEIKKVSLHPDLKRALVEYKILTSAIQAHSKSNRETFYARKDGVAIDENIQTECWDLGVEKKGRRGAAGGAGGSDDDNFDPDDVLAREHRFIII
jgi:SWI/SNF-related matrix-associated actin-dependent regulator of chromatin subfamily A member 5